MNTALELHDSRLAGVAAQGRDLVLRLDPAYLHRSSGRPGVAPGSGWLQALDLRISEGVAEALPASLPCELSDGSISVGGAVWDNLIPMPLVISGEVLVRLVTCYGEILAMRGVGLRSTECGEMRYVERFPGADEAG